MPFRTIIFSFSTSSSHDWGLPGGSDGKESACHAGDLGLVPGSERSPGEGFGNPLQYSCLENPLDRGDWRATVHRVTQSWAQLKRLSKHACTRIESTLILACVYPVILAPLFEKCFFLIKLSWHPCWHLLFFPRMQSEAYCMYCTAPMGFFVWRHRIS